MRITLTVPVALFLTLFSIVASAAPTAPRVAVFAQPGFPYFNVPAQVSPESIADALRKAGVRADLLDADALADPARCSAQAYAAIVLPYGNTYPQAAFANLKAFHQAGGGLVLSGIPFTHPVRRGPDGAWTDLGNDSDRALFGTDGIGVGGFTSGPSGRAGIAPGDPLRPLRAAHRLGAGREHPDARPGDSARCG